MKMPQKINLFAFLLLIQSAALPAAEPADLPSKPNILFAIADDWSYGHAGAYGREWVKTPTMDLVAREGILFTRDGVLRLLKKQLFEELKRQGDPRVLGNGRIFDQYPYGNAATRNYYDRIARGEEITDGKGK